MLSKSTEYAIRALIYVQLRNKEEKRPGVEEIATEIGAPVAYTAKILHTLTTHTLLNSMKGRGGGFFFEKNQSDLTLYDVVKVMEGNAVFHKCGFGLKKCSDDNPCPLHDKYKLIREEYFDIAKTETIESLSQKIKEGKAVLSLPDD